MPTKAQTLRMSAARHGTGNSRLRMRQAETLHPVSLGAVSGGGRTRDSNKHVVLSDSRLGRCDSLVELSETLIGSPVPARAQKYKSH